MKLLPLIILAMFQVLGMGMHLSKHGEERITEYNFWEQVFDAALVWLLLWWAGLFDQF